MSPVDIASGITNIQVSHGYTTLQQDCVELYSNTASIHNGLYQIPVELQRYDSGHPSVGPSMLTDEESQDLRHNDTLAQHGSHHQTSSHTTSPDENDNAVSIFQCTDCQRQYKRKADLARHEKSHLTRGRLDCPIPICKFRGRKGNPRRDKLIDHLLKGHPEVSTWPCPVGGCSTAFESVLLLGVHLDDHDYCWPLGYSIVKAHSIRKTKCPIGRCGKLLTPSHLFENHTQMERQAEADSLYALGFDHQQSALLCPVCHTKFLCSTEAGIWIEEDLPKLREHMGMRYLGYRHMSWVPDPHDRDSERLLSMWKVSHTFYHCREQILRFESDGVYDHRTHFRYHAIFDDVHA
ncbi:hypothetical protein BDV97DRAFT_369872 [Delphinella strobiligena]|nr:hypothetical protein BDV97DRAFT_369872 [Delphinella strobiligena]